MKVQGYASVFNEVDSHNDKILPGAFTKTLKLIKQYNYTVPVFFQHNEDIIIGKVIEIEQRKKGLWVVVEVFDPQYVAKLQTLFDNKIYLGFSIGYKPMAESNLNPGHKTYLSITEGTRTITDIHLQEISIVKFPANTLCVANCIPSKAGQG